jgi:pimeloyl-ACP methyl ester carboxylesterase
VVLHTWPLCVQTRLHRVPRRVCAKPARSASRCFHADVGCVINHDATSALARIKAPTQITFGRYDMVTSTRFSDILHNQIKGSEVLVFEDCAHAPIYENVQSFNDKTLAFLQTHTG